MANLTFEQFKAAELAFLEAFNRRDLATAFAILTPDCEFHPIEELLGGRELVGRQQVIDFFAEVHEVMPDWHVEEPARMLQAADDTFVTLDRGHGSGRSSGAMTAQEFCTVLQLRDGMVTRLHQYSSWEEGLRAAGLDPAVAGEARQERSK